MHVRSYYFKYYDKFRKSQCERCYSINGLLVHHKDRDFSNNVPENLETLCKRCHQIEHKCWENIPRNHKRYNEIKPIDCEWCGKSYIHAAGHTDSRFCSRHCAMKKRMARVG